MDDVDCENGWGGAVAGVGRLMMCDVADCHVIMGFNKT